MHAALMRLAVPAFAIGLMAPVANAADDGGHGELTAGAKFGTAVGSTAEGLPDALWAQGYGYLGVESCAPDVQAVMACQSGEQILVFQPVALSRKGRVWFRIDGGRIAAIAWDLRTVPAAEG